MGASSDLPDDFFYAVSSMCEGLECAPIDILGCWYNESRLIPTSQNPHGWAAGIFQAMPATLRGMGYCGDAKYTESVGSYTTEQYMVKHGTDSERAEAHQNMSLMDKKLSDAFCRMSAKGQVYWANRFYFGHRGHLKSPGACYMATFCPAWIDRAVDPFWVICSKEGTCDSPLSPEQSREWYRENASLDVDQDGTITPGDLTAAIQRATVGARWADIAARVGGGA